MDIIDFNQTLVLEVLSIQTITFHEQLMAQFLISFAQQNGIEAHKNIKGNIYLTKGILNEHEFFHVYALTWTHL